MRHGPNVAAQALLRDPTLRAMPATSLGRALGISTVDARSGIASVTGMVNRIAMRGSAALREEPRLSFAVGPFLSLDESLARYASHRGPIVVSPSPIFRPDRSMAGSFTDEAGDTNVSDQGDPSNADQGQGAAGGGENPLGDLGQGGGGAAFGGGGGAASDNTQPLDQGNVPAPTPVLGNGSQAGPAPAAPSGGIPGWVWAVGAAAVVLVLAGKRKRRYA